MRSFTFMLCSFKQLSVKQSFIVDVVEFMNQFDPKIFDFFTFNPSNILLSTRPLDVIFTKNTNSTKTTTLIS